MFTREVQPALDGGDLIKHMYGMNIAYIIYVSRVSTEYTLLVHYILNLLNSFTLFLVTKSKPTKFAFV